MYQCDCFYNSSGLSTGDEGILLYVLDDYWVKRNKYKFNISLTAILINDIDEKRVWNK